MKYFKNTELARLYNVSEKSVRNWVRATQDGKLELILYEANDKPHIANTAKNIQLVEELARKGRKFKNKRAFKIITPTKKFYDTYSEKQIFDIISNLTIHREIPLQYTYVDGGAAYWDVYSQRLVQEDVPNVLNSTVQLLHASLEQLDSLIGTRKKVNIVDLGQGNGLPVRELLTHLLEQGRLHRYIAIDISQDMLQIAERNIEKWFDKKIHFEGYVRDFSHERFDDLFAEDYAGDDADVPVNVALLFGGTLSNFRAQQQAIHTINDCLGLDDLVIYCLKLDTPNSRRYFDFNIGSHSQELTPRHRLPLDLLNIDPSLYTAEAFYNEEKRARFIAIRPKVDLQINFKFPRGIRSIDLTKNESILLWRAWHQSTSDVVNQFEHNGFDLMHATKTKDQEYLLTISKIKRSSHVID